MTRKISSSFALIVAIYLRLTFSRTIHISENYPSYLPVSPSQFGRPGNSNGRKETVIALHDAITQIAFVCLSLSALCLCVTVICLNFRPRLLTRTKWRGKPKDEYSPSNQLYFSTVSTIHKEAVAFEDSTLSTRQLCSNTMVQPYLTGPVDFVEGTPKISNGTLVPTHDNTSESTPIRGYHKMQEEVAYSKHPRSNDSRSSKNSLKLPIWAWKLIQFIADIGQSLKVKKPDVKEIDTAKQPVTVDVNDTTRVEAHLPMVSWWKMSTGARSSPNTKGGSACNHERKISGLMEAQKAEGGENEHASAAFALRPKRCSASSTTTEESSNRVQLPVSCETARNSELLSLASTADVIDPVYSRIRCSFDELVCAEDCGNGSAIHLVDHEQSCETCWQRGSYLSLTSEPSTHRSQHIYYELRKHRETQRKNSDSCAPLDLADTLSAWSSQHLDQPHATNGCERIEPEVPCKCYFETPPQLPARRYGESTVNLVNRIRSVLQSNYTRFSSTKKEFLDFWRKASTITGDMGSPKSICTLEASTHSLANGLFTKGGRFNSCGGKLNCSTNSPMRSKILGTRAVPANSTPQHVQPKNASPVLPVPAEKAKLSETPGEQLKLPNPNREVTIRMTLREPVDSIKKMFAGTPTSLPVNDDGKCHTNHAEWATLNCPTRPVWTIEAIESVSRNTNEKLDGAHGSTESKFGGLRHIDSEVDLSGAACPKHPATPERSSPRKLFYVQPPKPTSLFSQYQPMLSGGAPTQDDSMSNRSTPSPSKSKNGFRLYPGVAYSAQTVNPMPVLTMSPLMERSMEDEETRSILRCVR